MGIQIPGDELISDEELAAEWGATRRTLGRYDRLPDGLPFVKVAGKKHRPHQACREWLARRICHPNPMRDRKVGKGIAIGRKHNP